MLLFKRRVYQDQLHTTPCLVQFIVLLIHCNEVMGDHNKPIHFWHLRHFSCPSGASQVIDSDTAVSSNSVFELVQVRKRFR